MQPSTQRFKVRLVSTANPKLNVAFDASPVVSETRTAAYEPLSITHMPGDFQVYKGTPSREFSLSEVLLVSRTPAEARENLVRLNVLRSWLMPYFGSTGQGADSTNRPIEARRTNDDTDAITEAAMLGDSSGALLSRGTINNDVLIEDQLKEMREFYKHFLGAPPDVLYFSAYADKNEFRGNLSNIPVVMKSLNVSYPNDIDYIPCGPSRQVGGVDKLLGTPFPTLMTIGISLTETHSPREYMRFNLIDYRQGNLESF